MTSSPSSRNFLVCPSPSSMAFVPLHDSSSRDPKLSGSFVARRGGKPHMYLHLGEHVGGRDDAWQSRGAPGRDGVLFPSKTLPRWDLCPVPCWCCSELRQHWNGAPRLLPAPGLQRANPDAAMPDALPLGREFPSTRRLRSGPSRKRQAQAPSPKVLRLFHGLTVAQRA